MEESLEISSAPPETILPIERDDVRVAAKKAFDDDDRQTMEELVSQFPSSITCWATLGCFEASPITRYAASRVGYHRGLDQLRANGWRGNGLVRANELSNRPFLTCLGMLAELAREINEDDEYERCVQFLSQLDPSYRFEPLTRQAAAEFLFGS